MQSDLTSQDRRLRRLLLITAAALLAATLLASELETRFKPITEIFFLTQDRPVLQIVVLGLAALALGCGRLRRFWPEQVPAGRVAMVLAVIAFAVGCAGHWLVFGDYALSRDEAMVLFDAQILRAGQLVATVPEAWRVYVPALEPEFRLLIAGDRAWLSAYLPGNSALHALLGPLTAPFLAALAVLLAYGCARRLWPQRPDAALVACLVVAVSPQVLVTAMTPYAATAHLALDLLWLWLFLRGGAPGHAGALATGFVATGLHQIVFHPLYAAPFVASLWLRRCWRLAMIYTLGYALVCLFWLVYWRLLLTANGLAMGTTDHSDLLTRVRDLLDAFDVSAASLMLKNGLRFFAWMMPLLLPLLCVSVRHAARWDATLWALAGGIVLTTAVVFVLLPYQGHGWGYRYWHGTIGSFALLAAFGFIQLTPSASRSSVGGAVAVAAPASLVLAGPLLAWQAHRFAAPYMAADRAIRQSGFSHVVVDRWESAFTVDLVRNDPFLRNKPLVFDLLRLGDDQLRALCARGPVGLFGPDQARQLGILQLGGQDGQAARRARLLALTSELECVQPIAGLP